MEPANCQCFQNHKGRNLVVCIDGTSNQFGTKNTNVVELYSKIEKTEDSNQLTYYNSGIGTYAKPSWKSLKYLMQVVDNNVDLAIAWNFEKIIIGAYRWLSDNYQENDRVFLFGFSRGAYQVRALAGMIQRVGLIHKGNEEQIPFAYDLYATHTEDLATRFKTTFSRESVQVHFVGVWDTVSSVGVIRGKSLPLTDSADHICFFRHALALDERRVKFLPEYVHGGICERRTTPEHPQIQGIGLNASPRIKEVWFPGTHSDIGGGNQSNLDLDLGGTPFLWMSFEAVSSGLRLRPTKVEWNLDHLQDVKESLTGVWHMFEWVLFKRLSYQDESSTIYRFHKGRGRKIKPGQKVHSSVAFCDLSYHPRAILPEQRRLYELVGKGSRSNREWIKGWEDLIEMDIFDLSLMSSVIEALKSGRGGDCRMWVYRLTAMTLTDEGLTVLRGRPNVINDLFEIFTCAGQPVEVQECVVVILEKSSKGHASILLSSEHCLWLLRVARETNEMNRRNFAVKLLLHSLSEDQPCEDIVDEHALDALQEIAREDQQPWLTDGAFSMFATILSQSVLSQKLFVANTLGIIRKQFTAEDSSSQDFAKRLFKTILQSAENRQRLFDNDVMHSWLTKVDNLNDTERLLFTLFLVNQYEYLPNEIFTLLTSKLWEEINDRQVSHSRYNVLHVLRDTADSDGLRKRMWNSELIKALRQGIGRAGSPVQSMVFELCGICGDEKFTESLQYDLFDTDTIRDLGHALHDSNTINFFIAAIGHEGFRDKIFDTEIVAALGCALGDETSQLSLSAVEFFTAAMAQEGVRDKIFDTEIIAALRHALGHKDFDIRSSAVNFFTVAAAQEGFRDKIFDAEIVAALSGENLYLRSSAVKVFIAAMAQTEIFAEGFWDKIFDTKIVAALCSENYYLRNSTLEILTAAVACEGFRDRIFDTEIVAALRHALSNETSYLRRSVIEIFTVAVAQEGFRDKIFDTEIVATLGHALGHTDFNIRSSTTQFFIAAVAQKGFRDKIFNTEIVAALGHALSNETSNGIAKFFAAAMGHKGFRDKIFLPEIVTALGHALGHTNFNIRSGATEFFIAAVAQKGFRDKIFDTQIIATLGRALIDETPYLRSSAIEIFTAAIDQEGFRDKIFDTEIVAALGHVLSNEASYLRRSVIEFFTAALAQEGFRDRIFDTEIVAALGRALGDQSSNVRSGTIDFFTAAMAQAQEAVWDKIFDTEIVAALGRAISHTSPNVSHSAIKFFTAAVAQESFRNNIVDTKIIAALGHALGDQSSNVRSGTINFFTAAMVQEGTRDNIFHTEIVATVGRALGDKYSNVRRSAVEFFIDAVAQEGFRDNLFDTEIVATVRRALDDQDSNMRCSAVEIFTAAIAQEGFRDKIFNTEIITALGGALGDTDSNVKSSAVNFLTAAAAQDGFRRKIFDIVTVAQLVEAKLMVEFWSDDYILSHAYNHFITHILCQQLASADLSLRDQTLHFVSEAIKYDDVHTRICTVELRKHYACPHHISPA